MFVVNCYLRQPGGGCDRSVTVILSFRPSVNRITNECGNRRRPNMADIGKGWPSRSD